MFQSISGLDVAARCSHVSTLVVDESMSLPHRRQTTVGSQPQDAVWFVNQVDTVTVARARPVDVAAAKARTAVAKQSCADKLQIVHAHGCGATLGRLTGDECRRLCSGLVKPNIAGSELRQYWPGCSCVGIMVTSPRKRKNAGFGSGLASISNE